MNYLLVKSADAGLRRGGDIFCKNMRKRTQRLENHAKTRGNGPRRLKNIQKHEETGTGGPHAYTHTHKHAYTPLFTFSGPKGPEFCEKCIICLQKMLTANSDGVEKRRDNSFFDPARGPALENI